MGLGEGGNEFPGWNTLNNDEAARGLMLIPVLIADSFNRSLAIGLLRAVEGKSGLKVELFFLF